MRDSTTRIGRVFNIPFVMAGGYGNAAMLSISQDDNDHAAMTVLSAWSRRPRVATLPDVAKKTVTEDERTYREQLGAALIQLRALNGQMSQATLAERIDRSEAAVSRWETGNVTPSAYDLRRVAEVFDLSHDHLDLLLFPPRGPVSPVAERLAGVAAAGARKGLVRLVRPLEDE